MSLTHAHVYSVLESYLASDFDTFVRQKCTPTFTYELVPGDVAAKLPLPSSSDSARQHEFAGVFLGPDTETRRILEGLTGREVKNLKIGARVLRGGGAGAVWRRQENGSVVCAGQCRVSRV